MNAVIKAMIDSLSEHLRRPVHDFMPKAAPPDASAALWWFTSQGKDLLHFTFTLEALLASPGGLTQTTLVCSHEGMEDKVSFEARFLPWRQVQALNIGYTYEQPEPALKRAELVLGTEGPLSLLPKADAKFKVFTEDRVHAEVEAFVRSVFDFVRK